MFQDRFIYLVSRQFTAELSPEEDKELQQFLSDPLCAAEYETLKKFWAGREKNTVPDVEGALQKVWAAVGAEEEPAAMPAPRRRGLLLKTGGALLVAGVVAFLVFKPASSPVVRTVDKSLVQSVQPAADGWVEKQNSKGTRSVITLVDGSKVWLNADSRLEYPASFEGNTREVRLTGEAFFDVARNKAKPFIIHLKNGTVRVLGTSFNIKAYDDAGVVETSVATGKVAFIPAKRKTDTTFLTRNLKAVYVVETGTVRTSSTLSQNDKAWTEGKLIFNATSMDEIAATLERYFGKQVVINDEELRSYRLTGSFENNSAEEILYYLSKTKPFTYRITESEIILSVVQ